MDKKTQAVNLRITKNEHEAIELCQKAFGVDSFSAVVNALINAGLQDYKQAAAKSLEKYDSIFNDNSITTDNIKEMLESDKLQYIKQKREFLNATHFKTGAEIARLKMINRLLSEDEYNDEDIENE